MKPLIRYLKYSIKYKMKQSIDDFRYFSRVDIEASANSFQFEEEKASESFQTILFRSKGKEYAVDFDKYMESSETTAFIILKDDKIKYEKYFNGYQRNSLCRIFSMTKSFTSALIGIAVSEGFIGSIDDSLNKYIPEMKEQSIGNLTLRNLLMMDSGIKFTEGIFPWTDDIKQYFSMDSRRLILNLKMADPVGSFFHYNDYHLQLLAMVLERTTHKSVGSYFEEKIWKVIGTEFPAQIVTDSLECSFEKMESGICARAIDVVKFGRLYLNNGFWDEQQIVPEDWVKESTSTEHSNETKSYFRYYNNKPWGYWLNSGNAYYKYLWWGYKTGEEMNDFFALGILGQILYISPRKNTIVLRMGKKWGTKGWWPTIIKEIIDSL